MRGIGRLVQAKHRIQRLVYDRFKLHEVAEREEYDRLVEAMGFSGQWDEHRRFQMEFLKEKGLTTESRVLEFGCGPLTLGVPLIGFLNPGGYIGVDVRPSVANIAYGQIAKYELTNKNPRIIVSDAFAVSELRQEAFDIIWSFSVLYHLTDEKVTELFKSIADRLSDDGRYWANINTEVDESTWLEFPFLRRQPDFYEVIAKQNGLSMRSLGTLEENNFCLDSLEKNNILLEFSRD